MYLLDDFRAVRNLASISPVVAGFSRHTASTTSVTLQQANFASLFPLLEQTA